MVDIIVEDFLLYLGQEKVRDDCSSLTILAYSASVVKLGTILLCLIALANRKL
jgi:hypothetical protein